MCWLDDIIDSMDVPLSKLPEGERQGSLGVIDHGIANSQTQHSSFKSR